MQYTQQQRLAPEAPDESALYGPIVKLGFARRLPVWHLQRIHDLLLNMCKYSFSLHVLHISLWVETVEYAKNRE